MKYNVNINQQALANEDLDLMDCAILEYIRGMCASVSKAIDKQRLDGYTWINYNHLIEEMPLLRVKTKGSITPRIKRLEKAGFIVTKKGKGNALYVDITEKVDQLDTDRPVQNNEHPVQNTKQVPVQNNEQYHLTNNNHNIKTKKNVKKDFSLEALEDFRSSVTPQVVVELGDEYNLPTELVEEEIEAFFDWETKNVTEKGKTKYHDHNSTLRGFIRRKEKEFKRWPDWKKNQYKTKTKYAFNVEYDDEFIARLGGEKNGE